MIWEINKQIRILAPSGTVWQFLTDPARAAKWISESRLHVVISTEIGGTIAFTGEIHGISFCSKGQITRWIPERTLAYTQWDNLSELPDCNENYSVVLFDLHESGSTTIVQLTQTNIRLESSYQHFNFYWNGALAVLRRLCEASVQSAHPEIAE